MPILKSSPQKKKSLVRRYIFSTIFYGTIFVLIGIIILFIFSDSLLNNFAKEKIITSFAEKYPNYTLQVGHIQYDVWKNRIGCDSLSIQTKDTSFSCTLISPSLTGINWIKLFMEKDFSSHVNGEMKEAKFIFPSSYYELRFHNLRISVPDSSLSAEEFHYQPFVDDNTFFSLNKFRITRMRIAVPQIAIAGFNYTALLQNTAYYARSVSGKNASFDFLLNKEKPIDSLSPSPVMPKEALSSIKTPLQCDSVKISNAFFRYREEFKKNSTPATVTFDTTQMVVTGITNNFKENDTLFIHAQTKFLNSSTMKLTLTMPLALPEFSFHYSGSLERIPFTKINPFLEIAEPVRIKSGTLHKATYTITVNKGYAIGKIRGIYDNLSFALLDEKTRSEKGFSNSIISFFVNTFKIRQDNLPDDLKTGTIKYQKKKEETFIQFIWYALRGGMQDVVGF